MSAIKQLLGETVRGKGKDPVPVDSFSGPGKVIGLYFSAHWCGPCRMFTPTLVKFYDDLKLQENKPLEIVFLSSDKDDQAFEEYYNEMPWLVVPKGDSRKVRLGSFPFPHPCILNWYYIPSHSVCTCTSLSLGKFLGKV
jgi:nucleoredoxin